MIVKGAERTNPVALEREVRDRIGVAAGATVSDEQLVSAGRILFGTGEFERVDTRVEFDQGRKIVVLDVDEKPWGPNYLRFGVRAVSDFNTDARFSITLQHTRTWLNSWGAEWRNEIEIGDVRRFMTSLYQPLGPGSPWFVEPIVETTRSDFDIFTAGSRRTDRVTNATTSVGAALGRRLGSTGVARFAMGHEWYRATPLISSRLEGTVKDSGGFARFNVTFDTLDDANFPRYGYFLSGGGSSVAYSGDKEHPVETYNIQLLYPMTIDRFTLLAIAAAGSSKDDRGGFGLGGFLNLSGTPVGAISGSQAALAAAVAYFRMGELPRAVGKSWYAGVSLEAGNAWAKRSDARLSDVRKAASVFLGLDSVIGALYLGYGHTFSGDSAFYLFLGGPTGRN